MRLPLGVVIPTLNSRQYLSRSLPELRSLLDLAQEVVVVDSFSEDGTLEFLKSAFPEERCRFFTRPRGLYQSWNFGLRQLHTRYACIATAGDTLTAAGALHLVSVAERHRVDVVLSAPRFVTPAGTAVPSKRWPLHQFLADQDVREPRRIDPVQVFLLALLEVPDGIMGSSASNLYRTATFRDLPFRTDYDHLGDTAWGIENAFRASFAVTPECFSEFVLHESGSLLPEDKKTVLIERFFGLGERALREALRSKSPPPGGQELLSLIHRLGPEIRAQREHQAEYSRLRKQFPPWICNLQAWGARASRNSRRTVVNRVKLEIRRRFGLARALARPAARPKAAAGAVR